MKSLDPALDRQPKTGDPNEEKIRKELEILTQTPWAKNVFKQFKNLQIGFLKRSLSNLGSREKIYDDYVNLLANLSEIGNTVIIDGQENLLELDNSKPVIVMLNHLGTAKITRIEPAELGLNNHPQDKPVEPFPIRLAPLIKISRLVGRGIHETAVTLPEPFNTIQEASGVLTIDWNIPDREKLDQLLSKVETLAQQAPRSLVVIYPEGGTSGKKNQGGPYDLSEFGIGALYVAGKLNLPVMPVCQYFDPEEGYKLGIMKPFYVDLSKREQTSNQLENTRVQMQQWLNSQKTK